MVRSEYENKQSELVTLEWHKEFNEEWITKYNDKIQYHSKRCRDYNIRMFLDYRERLKKTEEKLKQINKQIEKIQYYFTQFERDIQAWFKIPKKEKFGRSYLRRIYCVYRLYKKHLSLDNIIKVLKMNPYDKEEWNQIEQYKKKRLYLHNLLRKYIGTAFKRDCMKDSCFAKPFFEDPDYIPPSLLQQKP